MNDLFAQIKDSKLHDYELLTILVDYSNANIKVQLCSPRGTQGIINIDGFIEFSISHTEKWGKGTYIVSSEIVEKDMTSEINIELNSGDVITFQTQRTVAP